MSIEASRARVVRNYRVAAEVIGWGVGLNGFVVLVVGWWLGVGWVRAPVPGTVSMQANTAVAFAFVGAALVLFVRDRSPVASLVSAAVVGVIAVVTLAEYAVGARDTAFDTALGFGRASPLAASPGRPAVVTAGCFLLLGTALVLLSTSRAPGLRQGLGFAVQAVALVGIFGYISGSIPLETWGPAFTPIAFHTATLMVLAGAGVVMAAPDVGWARIVSSPFLGGRMLRVVSAPLVGAVLLLSFLTHYFTEGVQGGHWPIGLALGQLIWLAVMALLLGLLFVAARRNDRVDAAREDLLADLHRQREELESTAAYARSLLEASLDPLVTISVEGRITDVNAATETVTGVPRQGLIGSDFADCFTDPAQARVGYEEVFSRGQITDYPLAIRHASGDVTDVLYNATVYRDEDGQVAGVFAAARDVTRLQAAEAELRRAGRYARSLLEASLDPLVTISVEGRITDVNAATETVTGVPRQGLIGSDFADYFTDPAQARVGYEEVFSRGQVTDYPLAIRHASGDVTDVLYNATVYRDEDGQVAGVFAAARDVTRLQASQARYRMLVESINDVVFLIDERMTILWVSESVGGFLGWEPGQLVGRSVPEFLHAHDVPDLIESVTAAGPDGTVRLLARTRCADGSYRWARGVGNRAVSPDGGVARVLTIQDAEELVTSQEKLADSERRYRMVAENATDLVWELDSDYLFRWVSPSVTTVLGWEAEQLLGTDMREWVHLEDVAAVGQWGSRVVAGETVPNLESRLSTADGSYRWVSARGRRIAGEDGASVGIIVGLRDIHDEVEARLGIAHALQHDALTGLANLAACFTRIERLLSGLPARGSPRFVGVLCIGVDSLKRVNEAKTHAGGDRVLQEVAARIASVGKGPDLLARGSGDEFVLLLPDLVDGSEAGVTAAQVRAAVHGIVTVGDSAFDPSVSIGIAVGGTDDDSESLVRDAALAMRRAKEQGRDRAVFFQPQLAQEARRRVAVESGIRDGLARGEFAAWFQPVVNLADGSLTGYEALVRWVRPDGTVVPPDEFLPIAERTTLIVDFDRSVLRQAVDVLSRLPAPLTVAVNVSATTLTTSPYAHWVIDALRDCGADPARLHLEFTETVLLDVTGHAVRDLMDELAGMGVGWYVDDFGTGYSSVAHLRDLPVAGLKLDLSFSAGIGAGDRTAHRVAQALAALASGLHLDAVAEGIETPEVAATLREQGWAHGQGWLYGRAVPVAAILPA